MTVGCGRTVSASPGASSSELPLPLRGAQLSTHSGTPVLNTSKSLPGFCLSFDKFHSESPPPQAGPLLAPAVLHAHRTQSIWFKRVPLIP